MLAKSLCAPPALAVSAWLVGCAIPPADARTTEAGSGSIAGIRIIDRTTGESLPIYRHRGRRYVAGTPGHRYAVAVMNRTGARILAVVSIDGVNAVSGETAAWDQTGYVFAPRQRWEIRGWRKSQERVAAFEFTDLARSYAARTGRPDNVGVIGAALFREAAPAWSQPAESLPEGSHDAPADAASREAESGERARPAARSMAPDASDPASALHQQPKSRLGTGHGRSEASRIEFTEFQRARPMPDEIITIHYDSRANLIALGAIPPGGPSPTPFPGSHGFVPDPPQ
jgi:hypothetical protein